MKKRKRQRYGQYYEIIMEPVWEKQWDTYQKKVKKLKKDILSLGKIPQNEKQLISTMNYFVKLINIVTNFADSRLSCHIPVNKKEQVEILESCINLIVARDNKIAQYQNRSKKNETVTYENLYLGVFSKIKEEDITPITPIKVFENQPMKVIVPLYPMSDWLNKKVVSLSGDHVSLNQRNLANTEKQLVDFLFECIDNVLA